MDNKHVLTRLYLSWKLMPLAQWSSKIVHGLGLRHSRLTGAPRKKSKFIVRSPVPMSLPVGFVVEILLWGLKSRSRRKATTSLQRFTRSANGSKRTKISAVQNSVSLILAVTHALILVRLSQQCPPLPFHQRLCQVLLPSEKHVIRPWISKLKSVAKRRSKIVHGLGLSYSKKNGAKKWRIKSIVQPPVAKRLTFAVKILPWGLNSLSKRKSTTCLRIFIRHAIGFNRNRNCGAWKPASLRLAVRLALLFHFHHRYQR